VGRPEQAMLLSKSLQCVMRHFPSSNLPQWAGSAPRANGVGRPLSKLSSVIGEWALSLSEHRQIVNDFGNPRHPRMGVNRRGTSIHEQVRNRGTSIHEQARNIDRNH
jgi:hypothetical protein